MVSLRHGVPNSFSNPAAARGRVARLGAHHHRHRFFQIVVIRQPFPNLAGVAWGWHALCWGCLVHPGAGAGTLSFGEGDCECFRAQGQRSALLAFAFCLGFGTTVAEPAPGGRGRQGRGGGRPRRERSPTATTRAARMPFNCAWLWPCRWAQRSCWRTAHSQGMAPCTI